MSMIVDIRSEEDYLRRHNLRSLRISPEELLADTPSLREIKKIKPEKLVIMSDDIKKAEEMKCFLRSQKWHPQVEIYEGGMDRWVAEGNPYVSNPVIFGNIRLNPPVLFLSLVMMLFSGVYIVSMTLIFS
ncbi:MAG: rhodanese-like domain-containing protein [Bdellovibrionota bacterium]|nr:hypothetical protein [Pseudobdellovibrionaceae bacterium]